MKKIFVPLFILAIFICGCSSGTTLTGFIEGEEDYLTEKHKGKDLYYVKKDAEACKSIRFKCKEGFEPFFNETGCGCEKYLNSNNIIEEETDNYLISVEYPDNIKDKEANSKMMQLLNNEMEEFKNYAPENIENAKSQLNISYSVYSNTDNIVSIAFDNYTYSSGAAHGFTYTFPFNYDYTKDSEITLTDIFLPDTNCAEVISTAVIPKIKEKLSVDDWTADEEWIKEGAGPDPQNFQSFNITDNSLVFHFDPYAVAPYAAGPQHIEVEFSEIYAALQPQWIYKEEASE